MPSDNSLAKKIIKFLLDGLRRRPLPSPIINIFLMIRWRCYIHLFANIGYPFNLKIGKHCVIGRCKIVAYSNNKSICIEIGEKVRIGDGVVLSSQGGYIKLGRAVSIHDYSIIYGFGNVEIGHDSRVACSTVMVSHRHEFKVKGKKIREVPAYPAPIGIGNDVWIGAGVRILGPVIIGDSSIVGAGSVVASDVDENQIHAGVPTKLIANRFD
jgi:acetyltransferase-like isoleucine patch superfamily enzyme